MTVRSEEKKKEKMTREEAGRIGGQKVARGRSSEFYRQIGRKGGQRLAEQRGSDFIERLVKRVEKAAEEQVVQRAAGALKEKQHNVVKNILKLKKLFTLAQSLG